MSALDDAPLDAQHAHRLCGPLAARDEAGGWLLLHLLEAGTTGDRPIFMLSEDPGAGEWLAPQIAPTHWLAWLALLNGGELTAAMSEQQARAEVRDPKSRAHGAPGAIQQAILPHLQGLQRVRALRRTHPSTPGDQPGHITFLIHPADVIDGHQPALERDAGAAAWVTLGVHFVYESGRTWANLVNETPTWQGAVSTYDTWQDAVDG